MTCSGTGRSSISPEPLTASPRAYLQDRESALFSRDGLATTIDALARSNAPEFNVAGHSIRGRSW